MRRSAVLLSSILLGCLLLWLRDDGRLRLRFDCDVALPFSLATGMEFFPNDSGEFLLVDRDGGFAHAFHPQTPSRNFRPLVLRR